MVKKMLSALLAAVAAPAQVASKQSTPGAFGNPNKLLRNPAGSKLARKAAEKTIGVRVPTVLAVVDGRIHIREVE